MNRPCVLCRAQAGGEALLLYWKGCPFWFCTLGCLVAWGEKRMAEQPEGT